MQILEASYGDLENDSLRTQLSIGGEHILTLLEFPAHREISCLYIGEIGIGVFCSEFSHR